ncbi:MAG: transcription antitermination factor NusB [FCB group bacterium]|nr:transcription antitermination factor NusB [FCB group bacterium]
MTGRRQAREIVLHGMYAYEILERDINRIFDELTEKSKLGHKHLEFARYLLDTIIDNLEFLDKEIIRLAENWDLDRIAVIDRIILRIALAEMNFMPDIPEKVTINEAIDMAKLYSTHESSSFVNGILDAAITPSSSID